MSWAAAIPFFGNAMTSVGDLSQADAESNSLQKQADIQIKNAAAARAAGKYNADRQQYVATQKIGNIEADYATSGITSDSGSVLDILRQSHTNAELDRQNIMYGADVRAVNYENSANALRSRSQNIQRTKYQNSFMALFGAGAKYAQESGGGSSGGQDVSLSSGSSDSSGYGSAGESYNDGGSYA